jgi:hypothetical protein
LPRIPTFNEVFVTVLVFIHPAAFEDKAATLLFSVPMSVACALSFAVKLVFKSVMRCVSLYRWSLIPRKRPEKYVNNSVVLLMPAAYARVRMFALVFICASRATLWLAFVSSVVSRFVTFVSLYDDPDPLACVVWHVPSLKQTKLAFTTPWVSFANVRLRSRRKSGRAALATADKSSTRSGRTSNRWFMGCLR